MSDLLQRLQGSLADRYAVEREIGRGGMATVFLARDIKHGRQVALKVLSSDVSVALGIERFQREIEIASALTHPHIVPLYDSGEADGCLFYAMPFITGESLRARLDREKQLPLDDAIRITCEVASALDYAHRKGVLHRDIKPANILLEDGHAVIADFGIARAISRAAETDKMTMTGVTLGTPTYMSPEQASGEHTLDGRSDVYALGCVLYEMLAGQPPFTGPNAQSVMARHAMETVPSLRIVRTTIPDEVEDAIMVALNKAPADRFATAQQFADALTGGGTGFTHRFTTTRVAARARRQRRIARTVGAAASLLVLLGLAVAWWLVNRPTRGAAAAGATMDPRRIAVLYLQDDSPGGELAFFADGLSERLIEQLDRVRSLDVVSRAGVARFRGASVGIDSVARALNAGTVVRGSVSDEGERVRVSVALVDGNTVADYGRASFTLPKRSLATARDSLALQVEVFLRRHVGNEIRVRRDREATEHPDAWLLVQRAERSRKDAVALVASDSLTAAARRFAIADSLLAQAEALDRSWSRPITARAELVLSELSSIRDRRRFGALIDRGIAHANRALAVDSTDAGALEYRGTFRYYKRELGLVSGPDEAADLVRFAEQDLRRATSIDGGRASAFNTLSLLLYRRYDPVAAKLAAQAAHDADAYLRAMPDVMERLYQTSWDLRQFGPAADWCERGHERFPADPRFISCQLWLLTTEEREPNPGEAWRLVAELERRTPPNRREFERREAAIIAAIVIHRAGLPDSARRVLERARAGSDIDPGSELVGHEVVARAMIGDTDEALELLRLYLTTHPTHREGFVRANRWEYESLRGDPRYREIVGSGR